MYNSAVEKLVSELKLKNIDLKEKEIEGILHILKSSDALTNAILIRKTGLPKETLKRFLDSISHYLIQNGGPELSLNKEGREVVYGAETSPYSWSLLSYTYEDLENRLKEIRKDYNLEPKREFDQFFATEATSVSKAKVLYEKGLVKGKKILLLGDDDLVSITLALLGSEHTQIVVMDIDEEILNTISTIAKDLNLRDITTVKYDTRDTIDRSYANKFDVVMTDPPYTRAGVSLFLNRAVEFLKDKTDFSGSYVFLCYGGSFKMPERTLKIQEAIQKYNFIIEDKIDKFNKYVGAESVGSASSLYILKATTSTKPVDEYLENRIYTYDKMKDEKFPYVEQHTFKLYDVPSVKIRSKNSLQKIAGEICKQHKLKVMGTDVTKFKPHGMTVTVILANSNLLIHTWPEKSAVHIDLVTCTPIHRGEFLIETVQKQFSAKYIESKKIE